MCCFSNTCKSKEHKFPQLMKGEALLNPKIGAPAWHSSPLHPFQGGRFAPGCPGSIEKRPEPSKTNATTPSHPSPPRLVARAALRKKSPSKTNAATPNYPSPPPPLKGVGGMISRTNPKPPEPISPLGAGGMISDTKSQATRAHLPL